MVWFGDEARGFLSVSRTHMHQGKVSCSYGMLGGGRKIEYGGTKLGYRATPHG